MIPFSGIQGADQREVKLLQIFPNCLIGLDPDRVSVTTLLPVSPELTVWHRVVLVSPQSAAQDTFGETVTRMQARGNAIASEDLKVNGIQQRATHSTFARPGRLSHLERTVWELANYVRSRLLE